MRDFPAQLTALWLVGMAGIVLLCLMKADGLLIYTLDDPYIHLAAAENIIRGTFGINLGEASSASSSILYPYLLAITQAVGLGPWGAAAVAIPAAGLSVWLLGAILNQTLPDPVMRWLVGLAGLFGLSAFALPMTGLEHSLHVAICLLALKGLIDLTRHGQSPWFLILAVVLLPTIRFEGIAMAGAIIIAQFALRNRLAALIEAALIGVCLGAYVLYMNSLGLPAVPSSVALKSEVATSLADGQATDFLGRILDNLRATLGLRQGLALTALLGLGLLIWALSRNARDFWVLFVLLATGSAHLLAGKFGWFGRYEVYVIAVSIVGVLWLMRGLLARRPQIGAVAALLITFISLPYVELAIDTPQASRNIHDQHYQMHRFATEFYAAPVAVNDLGWVSYQNDAFVLDLFGLGSEEVRRLKLAGRYGADEMRRLAEAAGVEIVLIYAHIFPDRPAEWEQVATLTAASFFANSGTVTFYATPAADRARLASALVDFQRTLPPRVRFEITP